MPARLDARTTALTVCALSAFASNSLLCRAALRPGLIDAASFTSLRLASGALMLGLLARLLRVERRVSTEPRSPARTWLPAAALLGYALAFSFAYLRLDAGTGALILFGSVQLAMHGWSLVRGHRLTRAEWAGLTIAVAGLWILTAPGLRAPDPLGAALMALAGLAWGLYSLAGRAALEPIEANAGSFRRALPAALAVSIATIGSCHVSLTGFAFAVASGALTSGLGYALWYAALRGLAPSLAAIVQLAVPVLAAAGGVALLAEPLTPRLIAAGLLVLGGIALATLAPAR